MTLIADRPTEPDHGHARRPAVGVVGWISTTDHKRIGILYMGTALVCLLVGGALAELMRAELARPGQQLMDPGTYNQVFTLHGSIMIYLFAVPFAIGLANYLIPLQIGAPDMAFPRLNMLSFWMYLFGALTMISGFLTADGAADFGWFAYAPLSGADSGITTGGNLWIVALILTGSSGILSALNLVVTIVMLRAPGMTMFRMPIFTWNILLTSFMILIAFPVLTSALFMLLADRLIGAHFFTPLAGGDPILWQHLFWFFGHPEVYIVALPYFGIVTEIFPVFSRRPLFGYKGLVFATVSIAALSTSVWAHHMFATGAVYLPFFSATSFLIAIPTGVKFFNWIGTMIGGSLRLTVAMLFSIGFLATFLIGGLTGVMLASPTLDFQLTDTYFVVAHLHYVLGGTVVFSLFAGIYFWWPKVTGRFLSERLGKVHFWMLLIGYHLTFWFMHQLGMRGMARRRADYSANAGLDLFNMLASLGAVLLGLSFIPFFIAVVASLRQPATAGPDPWEANSLEWATSSPPPPHNFDRLPLIRSERPVFDARWLHEPDVGNTGAGDPWKHRRRHDENWLPVHTWVDLDDDDHTRGERRQPPPDDDGHASADRHDEQGDEP